MVMTTWHFIRVQQKAIRIDNTGNVGIGTIAPNVYSNYHALTINGDSGGEIDFERQGVLHADIFANNSAYFITTRVNDLPIVFSTTNSGGNHAERMRRISGSGSGESASTLPVQATY